jgi:hypothetical protein
LVVGLALCVGTVLQLLPEWMAQVGMEGYWAGVVLGTAVATLARCVWNMALLLAYLRLEARFYSPWAWSGASPGR